MLNISIYHGKTARYDVLKIKFVDISHHRYKLRIEISSSSWNMCRLSEKTGVDLQCPQFCHKAHWERMAVIVS